MSNEAYAEGEGQGPDVKAFGFWIYLMSDLVVFSVLFATFAVLGRNYAGGPGPKELFDLPYVFIETLLLLLSSVVYGIGMVAMQGGKTRAVLWTLGLTFFLGLGFVGMEFHEFRRLIMEGNGPDRSAFLSSFFTLVGTHGLHVSSGLLWMAVMIVQLFKKGPNSAVRSRLMRLGMFWHFLDIVWVGVFTYVYLVGLS
ncbi:MAG TPA: cytochrome o ubiquinol oxidase subunit III [Rectinemataceae bacterium]|nr:cytochrome o ubiquinol oxidase subunit III [Rectinemataceae bacterium]